MCDADLAGASASVRGGLVRRLTLMLDTLLRWNNVSMGLSQVALIACAAGSCVMVTTAASGHKPAVTSRIAIAQSSIAAVIAAVSLVMFFAAGQQNEMSPEEYLKRNLSSSTGRLPWLLPLLYVLLALTLMLWAGMRYSSRSRRGRALLILTIGIVLIVLASAFFFLRAIGNTEFVGWAPRSRCWALPW
jgi:cytochrome bd-type quinol oxidase subunit 2